MLTRPIPISGSLPSTAGNALRRLRVNEPGNAAEWANDATEIINAEEARSDIRSTTRAGYSSFNSYPGLQALFDVAGEYAVVKLPANGSFDFGAGLNNILQTKAQGQCLVSEGNGAEIKNGNIFLANHLSRAANLYLTGPSNYGVRVSGGSTGMISPSRSHNYWSHVSLENIHVRDKATGVLNDLATMWSTWRGVVVTNCTTGVLIDHTDNINDTGDIHLEGCGIASCGIGLKAVKVGGLKLTGCKVQSCTTGGLILQPSVAANATLQSVDGVYISNSGFEDNASHDVWITADAGVNVDKYPVNIRFAGGNIHSLILDRCNLVTFDGVLIAVGTGVYGTVTVNNTATNVAFINTPELVSKIGGTGSDYTIISRNSLDGGFSIRNPGGRIKLIDVDGTSVLGSHITSIASAPAYIGQRALVNGSWYMAAGASVVSDWKPLGGGIDGGLFNDTYTFAGADGGAF